MWILFLVFALTAYAGVLHWGALRWIIKVRWTGRIQALERDLLHFSETMSQMVEVQMNAQQKFSGCLEDLEERIMELSVPSHDADLPLERRHQVLALARQGVSLEEIVKRLKAPAGEAELILNLSKYMGREGSREARTNEQGNPYV
jgi:hypothetical protein